MQKGSSKLVYQTSMLNETIPLGGDKFKHVKAELNKYLE